MKETAIYTKGETMHKAMQKHTMHKMEIKYTKQENKYYKNI